MFIVQTEGQPWTCMSTAILIPKTKTAGRLARSQQASQSRQTAARGKKYVRGPLQRLLSAARASLESMPSCSYGVMDSNGLGTSRSAFMPWSLCGSQCKVSQCNRTIQDRKYELLFPTRFVCRHCGSFANRPPRHRAACGTRLQPQRCS